MSKDAESIWVPVMFNGARIGTARVDEDGIINAGIAGKAATSLFKMLNEGAVSAVSIGPHFPPKMKENQDAQG